jgi:glycosyltransferase involved in cell wall biosynthesis
MKILYVDQTGQLGGGELALLPWLQAHHDNAHVVLFEDGPFRSLLEDAGVAVTVLAQQNVKTIRRESGLSSILSTLPAFTSLRSRLAKLAAGFDVLYANSQKAFLLSAFARRRGQPLIWHLRDILTADHFSSTLRRIAIFAGNHFATLIIVNSQATADALIAAGGHAHKIRVVHDGVSPLPFDSVEPKTIAALRSEIGSGTHPTIGVFGRLSPWKGQQILLEAISGIPNAHAVLVGDALFGESEVAEALKLRAAQPDLAGRVHFLGFRRDIPTLMKAMDIVAHTSTSAEPFGLVIVEGMLAGKPVIATRAGGAMEIIEDGGSGLLVTPGSVEELRLAIEWLLAYPDAALTLAETGRQRAREVFSLERLFAHLSKVLDELNPGSPPPS